MPGELDPDEFGAVLANLQNGDDPTREQAMMALKRLVNTAAAQELQRRPLSTAEQMRRWPVVERRILNQPEIAGALIAAMSDTSARVRASAALELSYVESEEAERIVAEHLRHDAHHQVRMMCIASLTLRRPEPPLAVLVDALGDREYKVVFPACIALGKRGDLQAVEPLRAALHHPSWVVRYSACEALVRLGAVDRRTVDELEALTALPDAAEHDEIMRRAGELDRQFGGSGEAGWTVRETLEKARRALDAGADES